MLLAIGILWGGLFIYIGKVGDSAKSWKFIEPVTILLLLLPGLIFRSAFSTDWHTFKRQIWQIMLLSFPGVAMNTILTAVFIKFALYEDRFDWTNALMLGALLQATNPVAVIEKLKELGASKRFITLFEGETLVNNGTAMITFRVFLNLA